MYGQRYEMALPLLEACYHAQPARTDYAQVLATCQLQLGLLDEADATIARASETFNRTEQADLIKASIAIQKKDFPAALGALERVREKNPAELQLQLMLAQSYLALRQWGNSEAAARQVLTIDPHNPQAFLTLARIQLHSDRPAEALQSALEAIGFQYGNPLGHFLLGAALVQLENFAQAERPLLNCLRLAPKFVRAQRLLARVYRLLGQPDKASICEMQSHKDLLDEKIQVRDQLAALRKATDARAAVRAAEDAIKLAETERIKAEYGIPAMRQLGNRN
jgi:predicted Zn-dependent protease